jgi:hypothetical protein
MVRDAVKKCDKNDKCLGGALHLPKTRMIRKRQSEPVSLNIKEFNLKLERGIGRNEWWEASRAIGLDKTRSVNID